MQCIRVICVFAVMVWTGAMVAQTVKTNEDNEVGGGAVGVYGNSGTAAGTPFGGAGGYATMYTTDGVNSLGPGLMVDLGGISAGRDGKSDAVFAIDGSLNFNLRPHSSAKKSAWVLYGEGGYSDFFREGGALNYGGGALWQFDRIDHRYTGVRVGYRNAWFAGQGNLGTFRISLELGMF